MIKAYVLLVIILGFVSLPRYVTELSPLIRETSSEVPHVSFTPVTMLFVGDIMLGRDVENYLNKEGGGYPFQRIGDLLQKPDLLIGNFEGIVQEPHVQAPSMTFQFSIRREYLNALRDAGFDILSLSNNHSSDYGDAARALTQELCVSYNLSCIGDARHVTTSVYEAHGTRIGILFGHTTWGNQTNDSFVTAMRTLTTESDIQIAYMHWGNEYVLVHNESQQVLAEALIDAGGDAIIGHHPHVVQDVALYKGKPIFYSLGNFIFDQYWNEHVQTGLGVAVSAHEDSITYTLIPFTTKDMRNQPALMDEESARVLIERVFASIDAPESITISRFEGSL